LPEEDLGLCPNPLRKLLERSFLRTFKNFQQGDFCPLLFVVRILMQPVAVLLFPAAPSQIPTSGIWATACRFSPLPDKNGMEIS